MIRTALAWGGLVVAAVVVAGCGSDKNDDDSASGGTTEVGPGSTSEETPTTGNIIEDPQMVSLAVSRDVDVLFVIDNSGSMAAEQGRLAASIDAFTDRLEAARANYRIGVTTTDAGNPRCPTTMPEGGNLVLSSCLDRVDAGEFLFLDEDFSSACTDVCALRDSDLKVLGTSTAQDDQKAPRRWVERVEGVSNIGGAEVVEALRCYLPQGVAGCGFESQLESMYLALAKSGDSGSKFNYGFIREQAQLAVVIVSDETDCSYSPANQEIFTINKIYWNNPDDPAPTSALCWRAGVACTGAGPTYSECHAENHDVAGGSGVADQDAVLPPISKYIDFLYNLQDGKQQIDKDQRIKVALITGVPVGYESFKNELMYEDSPDADIQGSFGIGPGCVLADAGGDAIGVPPVREREVAEAFQVEDDARNLYSICQPSYAETLDAIGAVIAADIKPICFPNCVLDTDPDSELVEPDCQIYEQDVIANTITPLAKCEAGPDAWVLPADAIACWAPRVDGEGLTPSALDDMSTMCLDYGYNLELEILRGVPLPAGTTYAGSCALSANKKVDCPNL